MAERFFAGGRISGEVPAITLLSGGPCCGKTTLLFQFAINCASEGSGDVAFICNKRRIENKPPFLSQGVDASAVVLQRIQMKYAEDDDEIKKYFAAFHLHERLPVAVIIDDFADFFSERNCQSKYGNARGRDLAMVRTLALCWDAIRFTQGACKLLLSDTHHGDSPRLLFIYNRWVQSIFTIQMRTCFSRSLPKGKLRFYVHKQIHLHCANFSGAGPSSYILRNSISSGNTSERTKAAKYSIALQYLVLEETFDE